MDGTVHIVTLDQKPCFVHYLEHYNRFIIATYELFSSIEEARLKLNPHLDDELLRETFERINHRAGKLILLRGNDVSLPSIEFEFDCQTGGGVFDAKVKYNKLDSSYNIYAAHSNGTIGVYKLSSNCGNKICLKESIQVDGSKMLTTVDIFQRRDPEIAPTIFEQQQSHLLQTNGIDAPFRSSSSSFSSTSSLGSSIRLESCTPLTNRLVVGDAHGFVTVINQGEQIRENVTDGDSIWQVKSLRLASERDVIIVGAENSSWYIYGFDEQSRRLILLYKNAFKDFSAGVTCISILDIIHLNDYDRIEILLASYDETLQTYHVKINHDGVSKPDVCHKDTISIDNGGIWRVKPTRAGNKKQLCVAAMYAGSYILSLGGLEPKQVADQQPKQRNGDNANNGSLSRLIDTDLLKLNYKPLHYDIDVSSCNKTYCIADFNNSLCLFKTIDR